MIQRVIRRAVTAAFDAHMRAVTDVAVARLQGKPLPFWPSLYLHTLLRCSRDGEGEL